MRGSSTDPSWATTPPATSLTTTLAKTSDLQSLMAYLRFNEDERRANDALEEARSVWTSSYFKCTHDIANARKCKQHMLHLITDDSMRTWLIQHTATKPVFFDYDEYEPLSPGQSERYSNNSRQYLETEPSASVIGPTADAAEPTASEPKIGPKLKMSNASSFDIDPTPAAETAAGSPCAQTYGENEQTSVPHYASDTGDKEHFLIRRAAKQLNTTQ